MPHQHENWQVRDDGTGRYCAACGAWETSEEALLRQLVHDHIYDWARLSPERIDATVDHVIELVRIHAATDLWTHRFDAEEGIKGGPDTFFAALAWARGHLESGLCAVRSERAFDEDPDSKTAKKNSGLPVVDLEAIPKSPEGNFMVASTDTSDQSKHVMLTVGGRRVRCDCGGNVFTELSNPASTAPQKYLCNACTTFYEGN